MDRADDWSDDGEDDNEDMASVLSRMPILSDTSRVRNLFEHRYPDEKIIQRWQQLAT
jgi:hypothetical protein